MYHDYDLDILVMTCTCTSVSIINPLSGLLSLSDHCKKKLFSNLIHHVHCVYHFHDFASSEPIGFHSVTIGTVTTMMILLITCELNLFYSTCIYKCTIYRNWTNKNVLTTCQWRSVIIMIVYILSALFFFTDQSDKLQQGEMRPNIE
jgi:hypothetical protein